MYTIDEYKIIFKNCKNVEDVIECCKSILYIIDEYGMYVFTNEMINCMALKRIRELEV